MNIVLIILALLLTPIIGARAVVFHLFLTNNSPVAVNAFYYATNGGVVFLPDPTNTAKIYSNLQPGSITDMGGSGSGPGPGLGFNSGYFVASAGIGVVATNNPFSLAVLKSWDSTLIPPHLSLNNVGGRVLYVITNSDGLAVFNPGKYSSNTNFILAPTNKAGF